MYHQILVHPDHQLYQVILWTSSTELPIKLYILNTINNDMFSFSSFEIHTLHQLTKVEEDIYPLLLRLLLGALMNWYINTNFLS